MKPYFGCVFQCEYVCMVVVVCVCVCVWDGGEEKNEVFCIYFAVYYSFI